MNSFKSMIKDGTIKRTDSGMQVRLDDIHIKDGFNVRDEGEEYRQGISDLAEYLGKGGHVPALEVYPREEGGVWICEGHRRTAAYRIARERCAPVEWIRVEPFRGNDADRVARIASSNSQVILKPLERAKVYSRLRGMNKTTAEIASMVGRSVSHVEQLLTLADSPCEVQEMVREGSVSATVAVHEVKRSGENAGSELGKKLSKAKESGKAKVTASGPTKKQIKELLDTIAALRDGDAEEKDLFKLLDEIRGEQ